MIGWLMGTELEKMWKEAVVAKTRHFRGGTEAKYEKP
jgi:hypothetical protein